MLHSEKFEALMAEPVSRAAWTRLVALLNAYVADGRNLYGVDGGFRDGFIWQDEISGMSNVEDWNLPTLITRSLARTAFKEMTPEDDFSRLLYIACVFSCKNSIEDVVQVSKFASLQVPDLGSLFLQLCEHAQRGPVEGFEFVQGSDLSKLGLRVSSTLLYLCSPQDNRAPVIDAHTAWWLAKHDQITSNAIRSEDWKDSASYRGYAEFCRLSIEQFARSGHLPDSCFETEFIHYLIQCDVEGLLLDTKGRPWFQGIQR